MAKKPAPKAKKASAKKPVKASKPARKSAPKPTVTSKKVKVPARSAEPEPEVAPPVVRVDSDRLLTLSFLRDGDEYCVRLEMASGQIQEFKNRSPDQLLTMVAGELEDILS